MHNNLKKISFLTILAVFLVGCGGTKKSAVKTPPAPKANGSVVTPTEASAGETPREKLIRLRAQQIEAQAEMKKVEAELHKSQSPAVRKATKEVEMAEKRAEMVGREEARVARNVHVSGCESGTVWVNPRVGNKSMWRVMATVDVVNSGALAIDEIRAGKYGVVVRNLCSGEAVTLFFVLQWEDSDQVQIPLVAISRPPDGGVATDQSQVYMSRMNQQFSRVSSQVWQVRLNRQYQVR
jgi:hypothetical protein